MLGNPHFYHRSIRKVVVTFGTLFNDIQLIRFTKDGTEKERVKVPLIYGPKEKYINRIQSDPNLTKSISIYVPRISFQLKSMAYDATRKQITTLMNYATNSGITNIQYVPIPYNFEFGLSVFVRNTEDGAQILEQILPFFTPDFTPTVDFIPEMDHKYDIPIILNSVETTTDYEGATAEGTRLIVWDLSFTAKGYIWPPTKNGSNNIIRKANTNIHTSNIETMNVQTDQPVVTITTTPDPIDANPDDDFGFTETITYHFT
jgi:hypothetical protein